MSRKAFTLAEILITLTVIGVVAALTIPSLLQNTNQAELKAGLKRNFADLQQATLLIKNDQGGSLVNAFPGDALGTESLKNAYRDKLSYIKECRGDSSWGGSAGGGSSTLGCWHAEGKWKFLNGGLRGPIPLPGLVLSNGTLIYFRLGKSDCTDTSGNYFGYCAYFMMDVNGFKSPNTAGKDIYYILITDDGLMPFGAKGSFDVNDATYGCLSTAYGYTCATKYLYD